MWSSCPTTAEILRSLRSGEKHKRNTSPVNSGDNCRNLYDPTKDWAFNIIVVR
jgi:hypothetical protein